jgi:hypothetical protein
MIGAVFRMLMVSVMVMRFGKLLEGMMHLMRCGIDQKNQKRSSRERRYAARDQRLGSMSEDFHRRQ